MDQISFKNYILEKFYDTIKIDVQNFLDTKYDYYEIIDLEYKDLSIGFNDLDSVICQLRVSPIIKKYDGYDNTDPFYAKWVCIDFKAVIDQNKISINITNVYNGEKSNFKLKMNDELIPIISKDLYSYCAELILEKYYKLESKKIPIKVKEIAENMGLTYYSEKLEKNVKGEIIFRDTEINVYDASSDKYVAKKFFANSIISDETKYYYTNLSIEKKGQENITLAHEIVHYFFHKSHVYFLGILEKDSFNTITDFKNTKKIKNESDFKEIQANAIASHIVVPDKILLELVKEFGGVIKVKYKETIERIIKIATEEFLATKTVIIKRLKDIKMIELSEDGDYGEYYIYKDRYDPQKGNIDYTISKDQWLKIENKIEKDYEGVFVFADNHVVLNNNDFIVINDKDEYKLTKYAKDNIGKCCIGFKFEVKNENLYNTSSELHKDADLGNGRKLIEIVFSNELKEMTETEIANRITSMLDFNKYIAEQGVGACITKIMECQNISVSQAANRSKLSEGTIKKCKKAGSVSINFDTLVSIAVGLKIPLFFTTELCKKLKIQFDNTDKRDLLLQEILMQPSKYTVDDVNVLLKEAKFKMLNE